jgi:hypothetical protein
MSRSAKFDTWKGEKVILPKDTFTSASEKFYFGGNRSGYGDYQWHRPGISKQGVPRSVAGSMGVIVDTRMDEKSWWQSEVTIQLDGSGERIVLSSVAGDYLGFQAEMATAEGLVGQSWWSKGKNPLESSSETVWINNLDRVTLTRVKWNDDVTISWYFKIDRGIEGKLGGSTVYADSRFHLDDDAAMKFYTRRFHVRDPRKQFPEWSKATWELIEKGIIAIGMSKTMAEMACGKELTQTGAILSTAGDAAPIFSCGPQKFLVENGKVTKYLESH